ncbi:MAG: M48 family metallopeptidase [Gemmataceae bacterium]
MPSSDEIAYPESPDPDSLPEGLTDYPESYVKREYTLLISLFVFLTFYLALVMVAGTLMVWMLLKFPQYKLLALIGAFPFFLLFVFLVKGFFKRHTSDQELEIEVTQQTQPDLFAFISRLCEEVGVDEPARVYIRPEPNAGVLYATGFLNLFSPPKRTLRIGLALINSVNLSEFKAILGHEFGHFAQGTRVGVYTGVAKSIILDMVIGEDWFDKILNSLRVVGGIGEIAYWVIGGPFLALRWVLTRIFFLIAYQQFSVAREAEYHADLVGASIAGSDAQVLALMRAEFSDHTYGQTLSDLGKAADHKLYTSDIYFHQHSAADIVRKFKKDPLLGVRPKLDHPLAGKKVQVFDPDKYDNQADDEDYHPNNYNREENIKKHFVPCPIDERSPWLLFKNPAELREKITYKIYRTELKIPRGTDLADPRAVQKFIDDEYAETTYAPKYEGVYDERMINPGDIDDLNDIIRKEPWPDDRLINVAKKLYQDVKGRADERLELLEERGKILDQSGGATRRARKMLKEVEADLDRASEWFDSLDRRAYLVFVQMAYRVHDDKYTELINRYRFHMAIQGIYKSARHHQEKAFFFFAMISGQEQLSQDDFAELMHVLREARTSLKKTLREAREMDMPAMKNFEEGDRFADFLLDENLVSELPETFVKGKWIDKLLRQLNQVKSKAQRLHFKSLGGILQLQQEIQDAFEKKSGGTPASIMEVEPE